MVTELKAQGPSRTCNKNKNKNKKKYPSVLRIERASMVTDAHSRIAIAACRETQREHGQYTWSRQGEHGQDRVDDKESMVKRERAWLRET